MQKNARDNDAERYRKEKKDKAKAKELWVRKGTYSGMKCSYSMSDWNRRRENGIRRKYKRATAEGKEFEGKRSEPKEDQRRKKVASARMKCVQVT